ncbi:MAG: M23 family metallopeptidase [Candidatus Paceibacterota bacterium]
MVKNYWTQIIAIWIVVFLAAIFYGWNQYKALSVGQENNLAGERSDELNESVQPTPSALLLSPISRPFERVLKKPLGIEVSPNDSPVSPEKFTGFHSGVDFETFLDEQNVDVPISAICTGPLRIKQWAQGYGGVVVQDCFLNAQPITVIYGHLKLASVEQIAGDRITAGEFIGVLGDGFTSETDDERKHLHLGIHRGNGPSILGYVQSEEALDGWIDIRDYLN